MSIKLQDETLAENHNLVMFPASKNFKIDFEVHSLKKDSISELLNEYAHIRDEDIPIYLDERFEADLFEDIEEEILEGSDAFDSLEAFMNRHQRSEVVTPDDRLAQKINERLDAIKEARARIKFYLDEIEMFLPAKRK